MVARRVGGVLLQRRRLNHARQIGSSERIGIAAALGGLLLLIPFHARPRLVWNGTPSAPVDSAVTAPTGSFGGEWMIASPSPAAARFAAKRRYLPRNMPLVKRGAACRAGVCARGLALRGPDGIAVCHLRRDGQIHRYAGGAAAAVPGLGLSAADEGDAGFVRWTLFRAGHTRPHPWKGASLMVALIGLAITSIPPPAFVNAAPEWSGRPIARAGSRVRQPDSKAGALVALPKPDRTPARIE